jgi:hypothetical protein
MTEGHKRALELIAENRRTRSPFLDLGNLGLAEGAGKISEVSKTLEILPTRSPRSLFLVLGNGDVAGHQTSGKIGIIKV